MKVPLTPLKPKYLKICYVKKNCIYIIKINWVMVFREIMTVRPENHTKTDKYIPLQDAKSFIAKASGTYSYHWALND
jgi:hypothetical protein